MQKQPEKGNEEELEKEQEEEKQNIQNAQIVEETAKEKVKV